MSKFIYQSPGRYVQGKVLLALSLKKQNVLVVMR